MSAANEPLYIGVNGHVVAVDRATGRELWRSHLTGGTYVTLYSDGGGLYAGTQGKLFCLDRSTGHVLWTNNLSGLGFNLIAFCGTDIAGAVAEIARRQTAAVVAAGG